MLGGEKNSDPIKEEFSRLWSSYPRKQGDKGRALIKYRSSRKNGATEATVAEGMAAYLAYLHHEQEGDADRIKKFMQYGQTFFSKETWKGTWKDEYEEELVDGVGFIESWYNLIGDYTNQRIGGDKGKRWWRMLTHEHSPDRVSQLSEEELCKVVRWAWDQRGLRKTITLPDLRILIYQYRRAKGTFQSYPQPAEENSLPMDHHFLSWVAEEMAAMYIAGVEDILIWRFIHQHTFDMGDDDARHEKTEEEYVEMRRTYDKLGCQEPTHAAINAQFPGLAWKWVGDDGRVVQ
jgi:hypothetical protein